MTAVIDLDEMTDPDTAPARAADMSFRTWLDGWAPRHPAAMGAAVAVVVAIAATIAGLLVLVLRAPAASRAPAPPVADGHRHQISIAAPAGAELDKIVVYRAYPGGIQDLVLQGSDAAGIVTDETASFDNITAVVVTVRATDASCAITVDGRIADQAQAPGTVSCIWVAPPTG